MLSGSGPWGSRYGRRRRRRSAGGCRRTRLRPACWTGCRRPSKARRRSGSRGRPAAARPEAITWRIVRGAVAAVEIVHLAALDIGGAHRQPRLPGVQAVGVDQVGQRLRQRRCRVVAGALGAQGHPRAPKGQRVGLEEAIHPGSHGHGVGPHRTADPGSCGHLPERAVLDPAPELLKARQPLARRIAGDQAGVDGADRGADHPVGLQPDLLHRFIDAGLIGAQRAAALEHQHHLTQVSLSNAASVPASCAALVIVS